MSKIVKSERTINPFGGINFVKRLVDKNKISKLIDKKLGKRVKQAKYSYSDIILSWIYANFCGADRLEDITTLKKSLETIPNLNIPSPDRIAGIFKELATDTVKVKSNLGNNYTFNEHKKLNELMLETALRLKMINKKKKHLLDFDNTLLFHRKKDTKMTYKEAKGYFPAVAFIDKTPVYTEMRDGNAAVQINQLETLKKVFNNLDKQGVKIKAFRADNGSFIKEVIQYLTNRDVNFYIRMKNTKDLIQDAKLEKWTYLDDVYDHSEYTEFNYTPSAFRKTNHINLGEYRVIAQRSIIRGVEAYRFIITNDTTSTAEQVINIYNQRGESELNFKYLKNDFNWNKLPFSYMNENHVFMLVEAIASIIYEYCLQEFSKKLEFVNTGQRLKNFILHFISVASEWINEELLKIYDSRGFELLWDDGGG